MKTLGVVSGSTEYYWITWPQLVHMEYNYIYMIWLSYTGHETVICHIMCLLIQISFSKMHEVPKIPRCDLKRT